MQVGGRRSEVGGWRADDGSLEQREERAGLDTAEQEQVQFHRRAERPSSARVAPLSATRSFPSARAIFSASSSEIGAFVSTLSTRAVSTQRTLSTFSTLSTVREPLLSEPHEDVFDEAADERRVVADARDAEAGVGGDAAQFRDVGERVQVIGLAQALLPHVDQARRARGDARGR